MNRPAASGGEMGPKIKLDQAIGRRIAAERILITLRKDAAGDCLLPARAIEDSDHTVDFESATKVNAIAMIRTELVRLQTSSAAHCVLSIFIFSHWAT
jgi:hypothetical protein